MINYNTYVQSKIKKSIEYKNRQRNNSKYRTNCLNNPTKAEIIVKKWLEENNIKFMFQKGFIFPFHRIVDFYFPKIKIILEIDGGYHNKTKDKDHIKDTKWLNERGMKTIRITNEDVYSGKFIHILILALIINKDYNININK